MTFEEAVKAMKADAHECNRRFSEVVRPKNALESDICPVCGKHFVVHGTRRRVTCSPECAQRSRAEKLGVQLKEKRIDELLRERKAG